MSTLIIAAIIIIIVSVLGFKQASIPVWTIAIFTGLLLLSKYHGLPAIIIGWLLAIIILLPLCIRPLRLRFISPFLLRQYQKSMPKISKTEREALEAGTVSWEGDLFNGTPDFETLLAQPAAIFTLQEKAFLGGPVQELCRMIDDWEITHNLADLTPEIWDFIKQQGFLGMIIPKQYGGLQFSASAVAAVLVTVYGKSISVATTISVPNSLGPAELLLKYGTDSQKDYYLPRLAAGEEIPCFALTGPEAGSDAASIPDQGTVCKKVIEGKDVIGINLTWDKRYITLCPVATVIGLAFHLFDPEHLLGDQVDVGITCALIPANHEGVVRGRRHFPVNTAFMNGPTQGKNVFIPIDWIIGGPSQAGNGWRMLMECLSAGRAISLPSSAIGGAQVAALTSSAYARIRKQFNLPIGKFEGVEEPLARIAAHAYIMNAALSMTAASIDNGAQPAVASAIVKYHTTELSRVVALDAMDIHGGKAICLGPKNYLGRGYEGIPIGITVEGSNILTRNLIIFGQGAIRCHRYLLKELEHAKANQLEGFDSAFFAHIEMFIGNSIRSFILGISDGFFAASPKSPLSRTIQLLVRYSAALSFLSECAMISLGAELKRRERISARLGDILSDLYLTSAVVKHYHDEGCPTADLAIVHFACSQLLFHLETAIYDLIDNFPKPWLRIILRMVALPLGSLRVKPSDVLSHEVANLMLTNSETRSRLTRYAFKESLDNNPVGQVEEAFHLILETADLELKVTLAVKQGLIQGFTMNERIDAAVAAGIISSEAAEQLYAAEAARKNVIAVDDFDHSQLARGTAAATAARKPKVARHKRSVSE